MAKGIYKKKEISIFHNLIHNFLQNYPQKNEILHFLGLELEIFMLAFTYMVRRRFNTSFLEITPTGVRCGKKDLKVR